MIAAGGEYRLVAVGILISHLLVTLSAACIKNISQWLLWTLIHSNATRENTTRMTLCLCFSIRYRTKKLSKDLANKSFLQ